MDNLTHSLVGALLGQAGLKRKTGLAMPALIIGANIPDVDAACFLWLDGVEHLAFRRGITHGAIAWVLLPLILAGLLYGFDRWQAKRGKRPEGRLPVNFRWLFLLSFIACLTHPALDWLNVYGVRLLEPFSSRWFYGDILFIIDVWLWLGMGFATWFSLRREKRGGEWVKPARIAIAAVLAYIGVNAFITFGLTYSLEVKMGIEAREPPEFILSPRPVFYWQRELIVERDNGSYDVRVQLGFVNEVDCGPGILGEHGFCNESWPPPPDFPSMVPLSSCDLASARQRDPQVAAFLFWSRTPFIEKGADGQYLLRDARYYDPRARDRFTVALPVSTCVPLVRSEMYSIRL